MRFHQWRTQGWVVIVSDGGFEVISPIYMFKTDEKRIGFSWWSLVSKRELLIGSKDDTTSVIDLRSGQTRRGTLSTYCNRVVNFEGLRGT